MNRSRNIKGIMKKAIAVILGITMSLGTLAMPNKIINDSLPAVSAVTVEYEGTKFIYDLEIRNDTKGIIILGIEDHGETVTIPSTLVFKGVEYPVRKVDNGFLMEDQTIKTVIFPDTVTRIGYDVLMDSSVENISLSKNLEELGSNFAANCTSLYKVNYDGINKGTRIINNGLGNCCFWGANEEGLKRSSIMDDDGVMTLGNWLICLPLKFDDRKELKISDLSKNGVAITGIAQDSCRYLKNIETIDLEGVKYLEQYCFTKSTGLKNFTNCDDVIFADKNAFIDTPWYEEVIKNDFVRFGNVLIYFKTDNEMLDFNSEKLKGIKYVCSGALKDCPKLKTIACDSDTDFADDCFYKNYELQSSSCGKYDPMPIDPVRNIENVFLDGELVTYSYLLEDPAAFLWLKYNISAFEDSDFTRTMVQEKTKALFKQMGIKYYGEDNDVIGTLSPTEEFYIKLKIFNYLCIYDYYDSIGEYKKSLEGIFLLSGRMTCTTYAEMTHYLLNCAGVETKTYYTYIGPGVCHFWNNTKIGDEWFESDDGWSAQYKNYNCILGSTTNIETDEIHKFLYSYDTYHLDIRSESTEPIIAERTLGDINHDDKRDQKDADLLWAYIKNESSSIPLKPGDINFDGNIDVTDGVLLDRFVNGQPIDYSNKPTDGLAPSVQVAFVNGTDYDNIKYLYTNREGYITLPKDLFEAPEGKKISYDIGMANERVRINTPLQVVNVKWIDENEPDYSKPDYSSSSVSSQPNSSSEVIEPESSNSKPDSSSRPDSSKPGSSNILGDVNGDRTIDIEDAVSIIQHINGLTPLKEEEEKRADVSKDGNIDIDDAVVLISYINGNSTF